MIPYSYFLLTFRILCVSLQHSLGRHFNHSTCVSTLSGTCRYSGSTCWLIVNFLASLNFQIDCVEESSARHILICKKSSTCLMFSYRFLALLTFTSQVKAWFYGFAHAKKKCLERHQWKHKEKNLVAIIHNFSSLNSPVWGHRNNHNSDWPRVFWGWHWAGSGMTS